MKDFIYFKSTDGGMEVVEEIETSADMTFLYGWLDDDCLVEDIRLIRWMDTAEVGQKFNHRLGCLVRLMDR